MSRNAKFSYADVDDHDDDGGDTNDEEAHLRPNKMAQRLRELYATSEDPPQIFAEMQELLGGRWVETARWVKYEEIADVDGGRWSTPHVASFDGKAVSCLQHLLATGAVQFDAQFLTLTNLASICGDLAAESGNLSTEAARFVANTIASRHLHFEESTRGAGELFKKHAHVTSHQLGVRTVTKDAKTKAAGKRVNKHFARKLERTAEGASVLVGAVDFLEKPLFMFLRQSNDLPASSLEELTEVNIPLKYVVVLLGPVQRVAILKEVGRVMASALSDPLFQTVARSANSRADLLAGLRNFADHSTMLAPGQWDAAQRISPPKAISSQDERKQATDYEYLLNEAAKSSLLDSPKINPYDVHLPPGLQFSGRIFGGLIGDIKRKAPFYLSDFKDGLSFQCVATVMFFFFILLTQMVSFGGLMGESTGNNIAALETIVSAAINGVIYHLFSAQPLNIISSTGPVLVFERLMYSLCQSWGFQFLEFRFWVGMWMALFMLLIVMFDLSFMVCFITRFTEDNFATLIATIFIFEAFKSVYKLYKITPVDFRPGTRNYSCECVWKNDSYAEYQQALYHPNGTNSLGWTPKVTGTTLAPLLNATTTLPDIPQCGDLDRYSCLSWNHCDAVGDGCGVKLPVPDVFFFSCLLFFFTFFMAMFLKEFKLQPYFSRRFRSNVSDFAVSITVFTMVGIDYMCGLPTVKLIVPKEFRPTNPDRPWLVPMFKDNPLWSIGVAVPLGMLACILLFMDHQITTVIVNRKEHKLKKGYGYHLDLFIVTLEIVLCSVFGITWLVAATVLAIGHINSLRVESEAAAPGEQPKFLGLREQRVTGILIFTLIGLSIFMRDLLAFVPMPVLYGCFLYMGVNVLRGCGLYNRLLLLIMPPKYQPDMPLLKHVRLARIHYFTFFQLLSFALLWGLKEIQSVSMLFPLMLVIMVFIRKALDYVFTNEELHFLDDVMPPFKIPRPPKPGDKLPSAATLARQKTIPCVETANGVPLTSPSSADVFKLQPDSIK